MGISYGRVTIRRQKTLWGSCSAKRNLNFNCLIVLLPEPVMEYVIIHELCHLKEMNHSPAFWREVEKYCPDYRYLRDFLKDNGEKLMLRM
jgi:predicted metal-dependent hydrolase